MSVALKAHRLIKSRSVRVLTLSTFALVHVILGGCTVQVKGRRRPVVQVNNTKASLELTYDQRDNERKSSGTTYENNSKLYTEELKFKAKGNVYDPKLMTFATLLGLGLSQQTYYATDQGSGSDSGELRSYGINMGFVPTKPYPFNLEANRAERIVPRSFQSPLIATDTSEGASMNLRVPNWPMTFSWSQSETIQKSERYSTSTGTTNSDRFVRNSERFGYSVFHNFTDYSRMTFRTDYDEYDQNAVSYNSNVKTLRNRLVHDLRFGDEYQNNLNSSMTFVDRKSQLDTQSFDWSEDLVLRHSDTFSTFYNMIYSNNQVEDSDIQTISGITGFSHQLYQSLSTRANVYANRSTFGSNGKTTQLGSILDLSYRKTNPWGVLLAEYEFDYSTEENSGDQATYVIIGEPHEFNDPFSFFLNNSHVDTATIVIRNSDGSEVYTEPDDYTVNDVGNRVEILPNTLGSDGFNITDGQTLYIDYQYDGDYDRTEDTINQKFRIEQEFDNGLSIYYSIRDIDKDVDSTDDRDESFEDSRTVIYGADYTKDTLTLLAERIMTEIAFQETESYHVAARKSWPITNNTTLWTNVAQTWSEIDSDLNSRKTILFKAEGKLQSMLSRFCRVTARAEYRNENTTSEDRPELAGGYDTDGMRYGASLFYDRRAFSAELGWDVYILERRNTRSDSSRIFVKLIRRF